MPLLFYGPGGGGGGNGYKYQSKDVSGLSYGRNADGSLTLSWSDPEDGGPAAEWKGAVVVCKEGAPPQSVDDGEIICESAVKNQYRDAGLILNVGGPGYYYGVFPYTKDYVVNVDAANVVYIPNAGYNAALENASWADIAYISSQGIADQVWSVGDEKELVLSGDYNGSVTMQIAGFNHDNLASEGKAGITFLSKQLLGAGEMNIIQGGEYWWRDTTIRSDIMPQIKRAFPADLQKFIKTAIKTSSGYKDYNSSSNGVRATEDDVFIPSLSEVFDSAAIDKKYPFKTSNYYSPEYAKINGAKYPIFETDADVKKSILTGGGARWWTRSGTYTAYGESFFCIGADAGISVETYKTIQGICFGFCI